MRFERRTKSYCRFRAPTLAFIAAYLVGLTGCTESIPWNPAPIRTEYVQSLSSKKTLTFEFLPEAQPILVQVSGADVNFRSAVVDTAGTVLSEIELAFLRSAPVYHVVEAAPNQRLLLEIQPQQTTKQAALTVNWYPLPVDSDRGRKLTDAWRDLATGLQFVAGENPADWQPNRLALKRAATSFARLDLIEPALWARYFKAYFDYYPLYRYSEALASVEMVIEKARRADLRQLELLGHQLAGQILIEREAGVDEAQARLDYETAQRHFAKALSLAQTTSNGFETIWAINNKGITSKYQDESQKALGEYKQAFDLATDLEDGYLVNLIGGNMAVAQETLGEIQRAVDTLERIGRELSAEDEPAELEHIWSLLGGYYLKLYEFPAALHRATRALALSEKLGNAESLGRNHLLLGQIYRELGQVEKSQLNVDLAIPHLVDSRNGRGLKRAYALAADLHRRQGDFTEMHSARTLQEQYLANDADRALWTWSCALDALGQGEEEIALPLFERSANQFASTSLSYIGELATLHACVLRQAGKALVDCSSGSVENLTRALRDHQASRFQLEGRYLWARLLAMEGRTDKAHAEMDQLIGDIGYFRRALPGVLGAWYWDARTAIFDFYLEMTIAASQGDEDRAFASLEALSRLRNLGLEHGSQNAPIDGATLFTARSHRLRELLARRERTDSPAELEETQRQIDLVLLEDRGHATGSSRESEPFDLRAALEALPNEWGLLTYHLVDDRALAWTGGNEGLWLHELGRGDELRNLLHEARVEIRTINSNRLDQLLAKLGERLIAPLTDSLRPNILFFGAGAFSDFPLEALVLEGDYVIEHYLVQNALSLSGLDRISSELNNRVNPRRLFLAGNPDLDSADAPRLAGTGTELQMVQAHFPAAQKQTFVGMALDRVALEDPSFLKAELVHIASHASIDLAYPELSRIELSNGYLTPADLSGRALSAQLVVLSACGTAGANRFEYDSQLGFVTEFLNAGARNVMATLWPIPDLGAGDIAAKLYQNLARTGNVAESLRSSKLAMISSMNAGVARWGAFQLYR